MVLTSKTEETTLKSQQVKSLTIKKKNRQLVILSLTHLSIKNKRTPCDKQAEHPLVYYLISPFMKF